MEPVPEQDHRRKLKLQICCLIALWGEVLGTWAINTFLYPHYLSIMPEARDLSSLAGVTTLALLALWALRRPDTLNNERLIIASLCLYALGVMLVLLGLWENSAAYLAIGSMLRSIGTRWGIVLAGLALCQLSGRACMLCIAGAYALNYAARPLVSLCSPTLSLVVVFACPLITLLVIYPYGRDMVQRARSAEAPINASVTEPASFVPLSSVLFLAIFLFRIAYGFALSFETVDGVPQQTVLSVLPILLVLALVWKPRLPKADVLYTTASLLIIGGFITVLILHSSSDLSLNSFAPFANGFLFVGSECFEMLVFFTLAAIGARNKSNAISVFAWGRAASSTGLLVGVTVGHVLADLPNTVIGTCIVAVVLFLFIAFNLTILKGFSFQDTIDGVRPLTPLAFRKDEEARFGEALPGVAQESELIDVLKRELGGISKNEKGEIAGNTEGLEELAKMHFAVEAGRDPLTQRAEQVAAEHGLTPRETEILILLAHGRNAAFLQEKLILSRNTIKTHVANIYAKLNVHSQQELINVVEGDEV